MSTILAEAKHDYKAGRFREAADKYRTVLNIHPNNAFAHQELARCLDKLGHYEEAAKESERALELDTTLAIPHIILGSIYCQQQQFEKGEAKLRKAIELDPFLEDAYNSLGIALLEQERFQEGISALQRALEINPNGSKTYYNLSVGYTRQKRYSDALREALRAFRLAPSIQTIIAILVSVLGYLEERTVLFFLLTTAMLLIPFIFPSIFTLPLLILVTIYLAARISSGVRGIQPKITFLLIILIIGIMYVYHILYGL